MRIGYARVSTLEQNIEVQTSRLKEAGCEKIYKDDGESGTKASRPEWDKCLAALREGDQLVSVRLDRWGRSVKHLIQVANDLNERGVDLICLDQPIDTRSAMGKMVFTIMAAVAEFEREIIIERTHDGLETARAQGKLNGRPKSWDDNVRDLAVMLRDRGDMTAADIAKTLKISRATYFRVVASAA